MTNETLAEFSNLALYSAMAVFTIAMVSFAVDLATSTQAALARADPAPRTPVDAAVGGGTSAPPRLSADPSAVIQAPADRSRKATGIAVSLTWLGAILLVASVVLRGASVHRAPLGDMFELSVVGCMFVVLAYLGWNLKRDLLAGSVRHRPGAAHARPRRHRVLRRGQRAAALAQERVAGHPRHGGHAVDRSVHDRVQRRDPAPDQVPPRGAGVDVRHLGGLRRLPRSANYLALAGFGCILVNCMVVNVYFVRQHSYSGM